jgi:hypothetical protein
MIRPLARTIRALLLVACLCAVSTLPALALAEPTIATPQTYRYHADIDITLADSAATGTADGEIDLARRAFRLTIVAEEDGVKIRQELILLDNRLYIYSEARQRWEYIDLRNGDLPGDLPETTLPPLELPQHPAAAYQSAGTEQIGAVTVDRWRASGPYNLLLPALSPNEFAGIFLEETLAIEAAIGQTDRYLYRLTVREAGKLTELGATTTTLTTVRSDLAYTYSDFNQPVTIVAPPGAVPLPSNPGDFLREGGTPLSRMARDNRTGTLPTIVRILLPTNLPQP